MTRVGRVVVVTAGLMGAGAVFGALVGFVALTFSLLLTADPGGILETAQAGWAIGMVFGAPLGAVTAPVLAWLLLRRVPLGRMFMGSALGATCGGVVGWVTTPAFGNIVTHPLLSAFIGCVVAAILLRHRTRRGGVDLQDALAHQPSRRLHRSSLRR